MPSLSLRSSATAGFDGGNLHRIQILAKTARWFRSEAFRLLLGLLEWSLVLFLAALAGGAGKALIDLFEIRLQLVLNGYFEGGKF